MWYTKTNYKGGSLGYPSWENYISYTINLYDNNCKLIDSIEYYFNGVGNVANEQSTKVLNTYKSSDYKYSSTTPKCDNNDSVFAEYELFYEDTNKHTNISSYANKTKFGYAISNYKIYSNNKYYFDNSYIYYREKPITGNHTMTLKNESGTKKTVSLPNSDLIKKLASQGYGMVGISYDIIGYEYDFKLYTLIDNRIETNCCLLAMCKPTEYKLI